MTTRNRYDAYPTPEYCVDGIMDELMLPVGFTYLEPCRGGDVIFNRLPEPRIWAEIQQGVDYLSMPFPADVVITNPPFSLALEFLTKALAECHTVVFLLRLNFLGAQKRREFWQENPPSHLFVQSQRPSFTGGGTDSTEYAWFVWDRLGICKRPPGVYVI